MTDQPERQVNADKLIGKLQAQIAELSTAVAIRDAIIDDLDEQLHSALHRIDDLAPREEITDAPEVS